MPERLGLRWGWGDGRNGARCRGPRRLQSQCTLEQSARTPDPTRCSQGRPLSPRASPPWPGPRVTRGHLRPSSADSPPGKAAPKINLRSWRSPRAEDTQAGGAERRWRGRAAGGAFHGLWAGLCLVGRWTLAAGLWELGLCAWPSYTSAPLRLRPGSRAMRLWRQFPVVPRSWAETVLHAPRHTMWRQSAGVACGVACLPYLSGQTQGGWKGQGLWQSPILRPVRRRCLLPEGVRE